MSTQGRKHLTNALLSAVAALLLLTTSAQSAMMTNNLQTTATPALLNSSLTTQLNNSSVEETRVLRSLRSCRSEHENFCENGGQCMYPQDSDDPFCICTSSYSGHRCLFFSDRTSYRPPIEHIIGLWFGITMLFVFTVVIICCCVYQIYKKSKKLVKSAPPELSV